jgi:5'-nucleotidase
VPGSRRAQTIVDFYTAAARSAVERKVARIEGEISRRPTSAGEAPLGDLVADAQLAATAAPAAGGAQIALVNASGIRRDLGAAGGWLTYGDLFAVQPFGNRLVTLTLTGEQLKTALEQQWQSGALILQVSSGFSYRWSPAAPVGGRVDIRSMSLNGVPIDPATAYRVTVNDFLAAGGDGFTALTTGTGRTTGPVDVQALEKYLAGHSPVSAPASQRISRVGTADTQ